MKSQPGAGKGEQCSKHTKPPMSESINCIYCGVISGRNPTLWKGEPRTLNYAAKHSIMHSPLALSLSGYKYKIGLVKYIVFIQVHPLKKLGSFGEQPKNTKL